MSKMKDYMQTQADQQGLSIEDYLKSLNTPKEQYSIEEEDEEEDDEDFDLPMDWEPDYNGTSAEERREQMYDLKKLR